MRPQAYPKPHEHSDPPEPTNRAQAPQHPALLRTENMLKSSPRHLRFFSCLGLVSLLQGWATAGDQPVQQAPAVALADAAGSAPAATARLGRPRLVRPVLQPVQPPSRVRRLAPEEILKDRTHNVVLDKDGGMTGRLYSITTEGLTPAADMRVRVLTGGGKSAETTTDATGLFSITGLTADVGGIFASGPAGVVAYGVRFVAESPENPADRELDVESAVVPAANAEQMRKLFKSDIGTRDLRFNTSVTPEDEAFPVGVGQASTSLIYDTVQLSADGKVYGQVNLHDERTGRFREVLSLRVHFLQDGVKMGSARVAPNGSFSVPDLKPGIYGLVGVGRDGVFGIGIEVVPFRAAAVNPDGSFVPVRLMLDPGLSVGSIGPAHLNSENLTSFMGSGQAAGDTAPTNTAPAAPGAAAGSAGTAPGGGGGGGGGGGLGLL
ncbi:MAG: hypothetical protein RIT02_3386, partial [Planctomycetota bacterium]